jgi:cytochrome-b5 reductase
VTGLTPCLQVIRCILEGPTDDTTNFILFFQNRKEEDILLRNELDQLALDHSGRLKIFYFLCNPKTSSYGNQSNEMKGYISQEMVDKYMTPANCPLVCICGPSGFNEAMIKLLDFAGHTDKSKYVW